MLIKLKTADNLRHFYRSVLVVLPFLLLCRSLLCPDNVSNLGKNMRSASACAGGYWCVMAGIFQLCCAICIKAHDWTASGHQTLLLVAE